MSSKSSSNKVRCVQDAVGGELRWDNDIPVCNDVDECTISGIDPCRYAANSECKNIPGSYFCTCRLGFKSPPSSPSACSSGSNVEGKVKFDEQFPVDLWNPDSGLSVEMKSALKNMVANILERIMPEAEAIVEITRISRGSIIVEYDMFLFEKRQVENAAADKPDPAVHSEPMELESLTKRMYDEWKPLNVSGLYLVPERREFALADKNECESGENDCSENADCTNTVGGFRCRCKEGFLDESVEARFAGRHCVQRPANRPDGEDDESDGNGKWLMIACGLLVVAFAAAVLSVVVLRWKKKEKKKQKKLKSASDGFANPQEKPQSS